MNRRNQNDNLECRSAPAGDGREFVYRIDAHNCFTYVNDAWLTFAREAGMATLTSESVLGRELSSFIADAETREIYSAILHRVRSTEKTIILSFRCDAPEVRRFMETAVSCLPDRVVEFRNRVVRLEYRPPVTLLDVSYPRSDSTLRICGWCKRIPIAEQWVEIEDAVLKLDLFDASKLPQLTHGICPVCTELHFGSA